MFRRIRDRFLGQRDDRGRERRHVGMEVSVEEEEQGLLYVVLKGRKGLPRKEWSQIQEVKGWDVTQTIVNAQETILKALPPRILAVEEEEGVVKIFEVEPQAISPVP